ncbi:PQQ-binding-like beta-propeller repeat protein, partial [Sulfuricurvum sp.]|uniref:outer membrane protein assembly factor BamB family protein n=1 Tax=Sulfuricurvum sp. TaxID=2025608 RepID=UPI003BAFF6D3
MRQSKTLTTKIAVTLAAFLIGCAAQGTGLAKGGVKASFAPVTYDDILNDDKTVGDVVTYGMGQKGQRYSTLKQINKKTVKDLVPAWNFSFGGEKMRGQESQPLVKDGVMYVTGSYSRLYALDIATGREIWNYEAKLPDAILPCCDVINRGAALIDNLVIFGTLDAKLVALDRETGKVVWKKTIADYKDGYSFTAAPLIVKGLVVTGVSGGEFGIVGKVEARDPKTGEIVWSRPTVEGHMGYLNGKENGISGTLNATWEGDQWKNGGAAPWNGVTYDPETDLIYVPTGNPSPWNSH